MLSFAFGLVVSLSTPSQAPAALPAAPPTHPSTGAAVAVVDGPLPSSVADRPAFLSAAAPSYCAAAAPERRPFESDHAFDGFVNPVTNPVLAKDPRSSTWARVLFVNNNFPGSHPFGGGDAQVYAMQLNIALTERLTFIADKDGYADIRPKQAAGSSGWLNLAAGLKYTFIRDVENQFLVAGGFLYEIPSGSSRAFQGTGAGVITPFVTYGKQFGDHWHLLGTHGYSFAVDASANSSFLYHSVHLDREIGGWFYPLVEVNWFQYTQGGDNFPRAVAEGDGLLNLGTQGMQGRNLVTAAVGAKFKLSEHVYLGGAYEVPLTDYKGLLNNRVTIDLVLRY